MINGTVPIESNLVADLVEHLNGEIVLETVTNLRDAIKWLRTTFFYVRAIKMRRGALGTGVDSSPNSIEQCLRGEYRVHVHNILLKLNQAENCMGMLMLAIFKSSRDEDATERIDSSLPIRGEQILIFMGCKHVEIY